MRKEFIVRKMQKSRVNNTSVKWMKNCLWDFHARSTFVRSIFFNILNQLLQPKAYLLLATTANKVSKNQLVAARNAIFRNIKNFSLKKAKTLIIQEINHFYNATKKGTGSRMGKGKGVVNYTFAKISAGKKLFKLRVVPKNIALKAFNEASSKLSIKTKVIYIFITNFTKK